eukprot:TRINITY_DN750_c1_g3_i1.p1 TRINITY_DN750_c1_g3~~TRINITY_DN750_c1_g3_i1.p1  ORF type:complete len:169 (-),score=36.65 TRINITY_DN750_c1_g3_i1:418-924(-)
MVVFLSNDQEGIKRLNQALWQGKQGIVTRNRILGLDVGDRRVGMALSDVTGKRGKRVAGGPLKRGKGMMGMIKKVVEMGNVVGIVVGWPLLMSGEEGTQCVKTRSFVGTLDQELGGQMPFVLWDERMSSRTAKRWIGEGDSVDQVAAEVILEGALKRMWVQNHERETW